MPNLDGLTAVRFLAALWVFLFHFHLRIPLELPYPAVRVIANGALAMPVFFMLSGLVLGYRYRDNYTGFSSFFRARVARIYPAYLLGVILCVPFFPADLGTAALMVPVDLLLLQAWYPNLWSFWHHAGTWSISVEFFLYASFPLLLGITRLPTRTLLAVCAACVVLASSWIPSLGVSASEPMPFPVFYSLPIYSLPTFAIGVALSELYRRGHKGHLGAVFLLLVVLGLAGQYNTRYAALNFIVLPLVAVALLGAANHRGPFVNRVSVYLGDISYAFFVYQIPLLLALQKYLAQAKGWPVGLLFTAMLSLNLLLAAFSHHWLEPWGRRVIVRYWPSGPDGAGIRAHSQL